MRVARDDDRESQFVASDVCRVLGITKPENAYSRLDDDEKDTRTVVTPGGPQEMIVISESGLYCLIMGSRKAQAKAFKRSTATTDASGAAAV